jgi:predicted MFS family arabinose efflux permease
VGEQQEVNIWHNLGTLAVLFCGGAFMYLLPFCKNTYYVPFMEALHVNNTQLGMMGSAFGITAMLSYLPGGWLADRISARQLMTLALIITGVGGFCLSFYPPYAICLLIHASWGITTAIFFGAMVKTIRNLANVSQQGKAFGFFEGGRGLAFSVMMTIALVLFAIMGSSAAGLRDLILLYSTVTTAFGIVFWFSLPDDQRNANGGATWPQIVQILKLPHVWLIALFTFCSYAPLVALLFIAPFTTVVYGGSVVLGASLAIAAQYVRPFASSGAGLLADRIGSSKVSLCGMILVSISLFSIALAPGGKGNIIMLVLLCLVFYLSMYCVYAMNYALLEEGDIPKDICGTAVGIIATLGYLPDVLVPIMGGRLLDLFPGARGYQYIFTAIAIIAVAGICIMLGWIRLTARKKAPILSH